MLFDENSEEFKAGYQELRGSSRAIRLTCQSGIRLTSSSIRSMPHTYYSRRRPVVVLRALATGLRAGVVVASSDLVSLWTQRISPCIAGVYAGLGDAST